MQGLVAGSGREWSVGVPANFSTQGSKGKAGQSQLLCVVMVLTQGAVATGHRVGETGETGRMGGFSVEEG